MRMAQDAGVGRIKDAAISATYDVSCQEDKSHGCPHGNVHNVHKQPIGERLALLVRRLTLKEDVVAEGPRAVAAHVSGGGQSSYNVTIDFTGGSAPFYFRATRNCTECCSGATSDFDVSADGKRWYNGTAASLVGPSRVAFSVNADVRPAWVRYTANRVFPQCAMYNREALPALPFQMEIV